MYKIIIDIRHLAHFTGAFGKVSGRGPVGGTCESTPVMVTVSSRKAFLNFSGKMEELAVAATGAEASVRITALPRAIEAGSITEAVTVFHFVAGEALLKYAPGGTTIVDERRAFSHASANFLRPATGSSVGVSACSAAAKTDLEKVNFDLETCAPTTSFPVTLLSIHDAKFSAQLTFPVGCKSSSVDFHTAKESIVIEIPAYYFQAKEAKSAQKKQKY